MSRRKIVIGALVVAVIGGTFWALDSFSVFGPSYVRRPDLAPTPPLKANTRTTIITVPVSVDLAVIRDTLDDSSPRRFTGKRENPISGPFGKTDIGWTIRREDIAVTGRAEGLTLSVALSGALRITDHAADAGRRNTQSSVLNLDAERAVQDIITGAFDQRGEVRGHATLTAQPMLLPDWRINPKLSGRVSIPDGGLSIAGIPIDVSGEVKAAVDRAVSEQVKALETQVRDNVIVEEVARGEWSRMCRSISLAAIAAGNPDLWLELRPIRAFASHPVIDATAATVTLGVEAETRIMASATTPDCPFPEQVNIVQSAAQGSFAIATPIEVPMNQVNEILNKQLKGRTFPEGADALAQATVLRASVAPSGDQLLISLLVTAREQRTWFGFGTRATVFIWVRPVLDQAEQKLRLTDMKLDVRSSAAFGLLGAAARVAIPYIQEELEKYAVFDLRPYAASMRTGIESIIADFDKQDDGLSTDSAITDLRLTGIEFDSKTLRVIAEAAGRAKIAVSRLPKQ